MKATAVTETKAIVVELTPQEAREFEKAILKFGYYTGPQIMADVHGAIWDALESTEHRINK